MHNKLAVLLTCVLKELSLWYSFAKIVSLHFRWIAELCKLSIPLGILTSVLLTQTFFIFYLGYYLLLEDVSLGEVLGQNWPEDVPIDTSSAVVPLEENLNPSAKETVVKHLPIEKTKPGVGFGAIMVCGTIVVSVSGIILYALFKFR